MAELAWGFDATSNNKPQRTKQILSLCMRGDIRNVSTVLAGERMNLYYFVLPAPQVSTAVLVWCEIINQGMSLSRCCKIRLKGYYGMNCISYISRLL